MLSFIKWLVNWSQIMFSNKITNRLDDLLLLWIVNWIDSRSELYSISFQNRILLLLSQICKILLLFVCLFIFFFIIISYWYVHGRCGSPVSRSNVFSAGDKKVLNYWLIIHYQRTNIPTLDRNVTEWERKTNVCGDTNEREAVA